MLRSDAGTAPLNLLSLRSRYVRFVRRSKLAGMLDAMLLLFSCKDVRFGSAPAFTTRI